MKNDVLYILAHDKPQPTYVDYAISSGGREIRKNATTSALESLGAT